MWAAITKPFAWLMIWLYNLTGNYGISIMLFSLAVTLIMSPFMAKSKLSMMRSSRLQPMLQELQKRHEGNPQKLNAETQKLYREEGVNPMSGCLWSLVQFPVMIALYSVIRQPLSRMMFVSQEFITTLQDYFVTKGLYVIPERANAYFEIELANLTHNNWAAVQADLAGKLDPNLIDLDFSFLGLNLGNQPQWNFFMNTDWGDVSVWLPALGLFLIPIVSALLSWVSMKVSSANNPQNDQAAAQMKSMNMMMPIMSVWFCFIMPAAMGVYWIANSLFNMLRDAILNLVFKKKLAKEDAERLERRSAREKELEEKRLETERLRAEGRTEQNSNTSKKKIQANEKQKNDARKAAIEKAERAARRERLGIKDAEKPASQVGNRRYARGRAYVEDRYINPEEAEAATLAAAEESEFADAIDYDVADDVIVEAAEEMNEEAVLEEQEAQSEDAAGDNEES